MRHFSDQEIIEAIVKGQDTDVIDSLYATVLPNVKKHVVGNGGSLDDAFDLFQEALMVFYRLAVTGKFDSTKYKVHGFVFTICKNLWINQMKKKATSQNWEKKREIEGFDETVLDNIISNERKAALDQLFQTLGDKCVEILTLFFYNKLSLKEIAEKLGDTSEDAVKVKSHRCKKQLADKVKGNKYLMEQLRN
jgi:RNA polymerase sigma factor (sigma-70 family)